MKAVTRRGLGTLYLAVLIACSARTADAASSRTSSTSTPSTVKAGTTHHRHRAHRARRARRGPPGGVVYARSAVVFDPVTNEVLFQKNAATSVPIASLTKLMTAIVFLDQKPDLERTVEVTREDLSGAGHTQLRRGEIVALGDLLHMSLMCSDNAATRVIVRESGVSLEDYLSQMNKRAAELELADTRFVECTGLDEHNVSTATDVAKLLRAAADHETIRSISTTRKYEFRTARRSHFIGNTNRLLYSHYEILGGKTGFINEAGYCLATWVRSEGRDVIAVVLGAPTNATRFADVVRMMQKTTKPTFAPTQN
jgi:D-alanyl-D-alanine endopeptidase (penicillin-binding protein 7)